jgi:hypothetical protein
LLGRKGCLQGGVGTIRTHFECDALKELETRDRCFGITKVI